MPFDNTGREMVSFRFNPDSSGETQDKLDMLAREEGAGQTDFKTNEDNITGVAIFSNEEDAQRFAKRAKTFAGLTIIGAMTTFRVNR